MNLKFSRFCLSVSTLIMFTGLINVIQAQKEISIERKTLINERQQAARLAEVYLQRQIEGDGKIILGRFANSGKPLKLDQPDWELLTLRALIHQQAHQPDLARIGAIQALLKRWEGQLAATGPDELPALTLEKAGKRFTHLHALLLQVYSDMIALNMPGAEKKYAERVDGMVKFLMKLRRSDGLFHAYYNKDGKADGPSVPLTDGIAFSVIARDAVRRGDDDKRLRMPVLEMANTMYTAYMRQAASSKAALPLTIAFSRFAVEGYVALSLSDWPMAVQYRQGRTEDVIQWVYKGMTPTTDPKADLNNGAGDILAMSHIWHFAKKRWSKNKLRGLSILVDQRYADLMQRQMGHSREAAWVIRINPHKSIRGALIEGGKSHVSIIAPSAYVILANRLSDSFKE